MSVPDLLSLGGLPASSINYWTFSLLWKGHKKLEIDCHVHERRPTYLSVKASIKHQESDGCFYGFKGKSRHIGRIHLVRENNPRFKETIIHEAGHAIFEMMTKMGRSIPARYEESIVDGIGKLACEMLDCIEDCSI